MSQAVSHSEHEIDLGELFAALWRSKLLIMAFTFVFALLSVALALYLPNIYRADTLLAPASATQKNGLGGLAGQLGGLASIAGISLGGTGTDKTALALETVRSRDFVSRFIQNNDALVALMAVKSWDQNSGELVIDADIYTAGNWVREVRPPKQAKPSLQEAYEEFIKLLNVSQNKENGMVTLSIEHVSPVVAQQWVTNMVAQLNDYMKRRDMAEAQKSLHYLETKLQQTQIEELRQALYQLIEEQTKTLMLTQVSDEYVFKTIDPAVVPEKKAKPSRALLCIIGTLFGGFLGCFVVFIRFLFNRPRV